MSAGRGPEPALSVSLQRVTFDLSCCHHAGSPATLSIKLPTEVLAYMVFEGQDGRVVPFAPSTWHNVAFDPFALSQPSSKRAARKMRARLPLDRETAHRDIDPAVAMTRWKGHQCRLKGQK